MDEILNFMRSPVISINAQSTVQEGAEQLIKNKVSSLLVMENGKYVGIVTKSDMIREVVAKGLVPNTTIINTIMSQPIITMDHYLTRSDANEFMLRKKIKHLAVTREHEIVGMLTIKDMVSGGGQSII